MLVRFLPIPRQEAIPSLEPVIPQRSWLTPGRGHILPTFLSFQNVAFQRVSTEHRLGKDHKAGNASQTRNWPRCNHGFEKRAGQVLCPMWRGH
jgi:hypothetical protein